MALPRHPRRGGCRIRRALVAGLPFFTPETVTTDHRFVYRDHYLVETNGDSKPAYVTTNVLRLTGPGEARDGWCGDQSWMSR